MRLLWQIAISSWRAKPLRASLTVGAVAIGAALVVAVTSGYESGREAIFSTIREQAGTVDFQLRHSYHGNLPQSLHRKLKNEEQVATVAARLVGVLPMEVRSTRMPLRVTGIQPQVEYRLRPPYLAEGRLLESDDRRAIVLDAAVAEAAGVSLNDTVTIFGLGTKHEFSVVGICRRPTLANFQQPRAFVPLEEAQRLLNQRDAITDIGIEMIDAAELRTAHARLTAICGPTVRISTPTSLQEQRRQNMSMTAMMMYLAASISMLVSLFIVATTLGMGIVERRSQLGLLRCLGATRSQLAGLMFLEGIPIGLIGTLVGIPVGLLLAKSLTLYYHEYFEGLKVGYLGILLALAGGLAVAILASAAPAWIASRLAPLEAVRAQANPPGKSKTYWAALAGVMLLIMQSGMLYLSNDRTFILYSYLFVGIPLLFFGYFLIAPLLVRLVCHLFIAPAAMIMRINRHLLHDQIGAGVWRTAATATALMVGLSLMINLSVNAASLLTAWQFPTNFPDAFVVSLVDLRPGSAQQLMQVKGVRESAAMNAIPIRLGARTFSVGHLLFDRTYYLAVNPEEFSAMLPIEFIEGDAESAFDELKKGDAVLVATEFKNAQNLGVGDSIVLDTIRGKKRFRIAGVVDSPGLEAAKIFFDLGTGFHNVAISSIIGTRSDAARYFDVKTVNFFLVNLDESIDDSEFSQRVAALFNKPGLISGTTRQVKQQIEEMVRRAVRALQTIALAALVIASIGVCNAVMANIDSRKRHLGVLRALGLDRGQLMRLILAEAILIALIGAALGLLHGLHMAAIAVYLDKIIFGFESIWTVPAETIFVPALIAILAAVSVSLVPAIRASRANIAAALGDI